MFKSKVTIPVNRHYVTTRHIDKFTTMPVEQAVITQSGDIIIEAQCTSDELNESGVIIDAKACMQTTLDLKEQIYADGLGEQTPEQFLTMLSERLQGVGSLRFKNAELDVELVLTETPEAELTELAVAGTPLTKDEFEQAIDTAYDKLHGAIDKLITDKLKAHKKTE